MKAAHLFALSVLFTAIMIAGCAAPGQVGAQKNNSSMKVIGLIGGVSWYSSAEYYRIMNQAVNDRLGDPHSAKILMYSINFADVSDEVTRGAPQDLEVVKGVMVDAAQRLERGGADFIIVGSNTMNAFDGDIAANVRIPVLNIADATGQKVKESGVKKVILLGSKIVMDNGYYTDILEKKYGLTVILPNETEKDYLNSVIFSELVVGKFKNESRAGVVKIIERLEKEQGAEGVILGCTELPLLIKQSDVGIPSFDTTTIHAEAAAKYALGEESFPS